MLLRLRRFADTGKRPLLRVAQLGRRRLAGERVAIGRRRPLDAALALLRCDQRERAPRSRAVVVRDPERQVDERGRDLVDDPVDRPRLDAGRRRPRRQPTTTPRRRAPCSETATTEPLRTPFSTAYVNGPCERPGRDERIDRGERHPSSLVVPSAAPPGRALVASRRARPLRARSRWRSRAGAPARTIQATSVAYPYLRLTLKSSCTTKRIDPAAIAKKPTDSASLTHAWPMSVPTNVGPPPISPSSARKPQLGRSSSDAIGPTIPKPSVALWSPKPMIERERETDLAGRRRLPDGEPLAEVVQPDPRRDQQREPPRGRQRLEPRARRELVHRRRARADERRVPPPAHPPVVVDEAHQAGDEARAEQDASQANRPHDPSPSTAPSSASSTGPTPWTSTSQSRNSRMPVASAHSAACNRRIRARACDRAGARGRSCRRRSRRERGSAQSSSTRPPSTRCKATLTALRRRL